MNTERTPRYIKLDERNHVEKPLLDQLEGLDWEIIDLDNKQHPADSHRDSFAEVVMPAVLREQLKVLNTCLENDQVKEVVRQLTANFLGTGLIENNRHIPISEFFHPMPPRSVPLAARRPPKYPPLYSDG